jgi:hypothetical protein
MSDVFISSAKVTPNFDYTMAVRLLKHKNPVPGWRGGARLVHEGPDEKEGILLSPTLSSTSVWRRGRRRGRFLFMSQPRDPAKYFKIPLLLE